MSLLIKSQHQLHWTLEMNFRFDDKPDKSVTLDQGQYIIIKFRRNDNVYSRAGKIIAVNPIMLETQPVSFTGSITVDFSGQFNATRINISACDILDIRICSQAQLETLAPNYEVGDRMFDDSYIMPSIVAIKGAGVGYAGVDLSGVNFAGK